MPSITSRDITTALKTIWLAANLPCSKRLKAILPLWLSGYEQTYGKLAEDVYQALVMISAATIDRLLRPQPPGVYLSGAIHDQARNASKEADSNRNQSMG